MPENRAPRVNVINRLSGFFPHFLMAVFLFSVFSNFRLFFYGIAGDLPADRETIAFTVLVFMCLIYVLWERFCFKRRSPLKTVLFTALWVFLILAGIEGALSLFDLKHPSIYRFSPSLGWELNPGLVNVRADDDRYRVFTDRGGFRTGPEEQQRDPYEKKTENQLRVLILGDSAAFGWPLDYQSTFSFFLSRDLKRLYPHREVRIYNGAVPGYSSLQGLLFLEESGWRTDPDIIVIAFNNDPFLEEASDRESLPRSPASKAQQLLYKCRIYRVIRDLLGGRPIGPEKPEGKRKKLTPRVSLKESGENLNKMLNMAKQRNVKALVISMPVSGATRDYKDLALYRRIMEERSLESGALFVDLFNDSRRDWTDLMSDGLHPAEEGHRVISLEIEKAAGNSGGESSKHAR